MSASLWKRWRVPAYTLFVLVVSVVFLGSCSALGLGGGDELYFELSAPAEVNSNQEFTVEVSNATLTDGGVFT